MLHAAFSLPRSATPLHPTLDQSQTVEYDTLNRDLGRGGAGFWTGSVTAGAALPGASTALPEIVKLCEHHHSPYGGWFALERLCVAHKGDYYPYKVRVIDEAGVHTGVSPANLSAVHTALCGTDCLFIDPRLDFLYAADAIGATALHHRLDQICEYVAERWTHVERLCADTYNAAQLEDRLTPIARAIERSTARPWQTEDLERFVRHHLTPSVPVLDRITERTVGGPLSGRDLQRMPRGAVSIDCAVPPPLAPSPDAYELGVEAFRCLAEALETLVLTDVDVAYMVRDGAVQATGRQIHHLVDRYLPLRPRPLAEQMEDVMDLDAIAVRAAEFLVDEAPLSGNGELRIRKTFGEQALITVCEAGSTLPLFEVPFDFAALSLCSAGVIVGPI